MIDVESVLKQASDMYQAQSGEPLRSRQIVALAIALVEHVNAALRDYQVAPGLGSRFVTEYVDAD